jgi:hypothetical protein
MFKTSRVYARMLFVGDVMIIGGNHYTVTKIRQNEDRNTVLYFHYLDNPERKIILVIPSNEIFQIKHR